MVQCLEQGPLRKAKVSIFKSTCYLRVVVTSSFCHSRWVLASVAFLWSFRCICFYIYSMSSCIYFVWFGYDLLFLIVSLKLVQQCYLQDMQMHLASDRGNVFQYVEPNSRLKIELQNFSTQQSQIHGEELKINITAQDKIQISQN